MTEYAEEVEKMSFEESIKTLEDLVKELEAGGIDLDRSIEIYEKAVLLRNHCRAILEDGERRIQKIVEDSKGLKKEGFDLD